MTLQLFAGGAALAAVAAVTAGLGRRSPHRFVRWIATVYVEAIRGTSALVQLFWVYFALPFFGIRLSAMVAGIVVLGLNTGAYGAEVVRAAIQSVPKGQWEAATALNLPAAAAWRRIVIPQALRIALPPANNLSIELLKNTSLVSLITLSELTFQAQSLRAATLRTTEIFGLVLLLYFGAALAVTGAFRIAERRLARTAA